MLCAHTLASVNATARLPQVAYLCRKANPHLGPLDRPFVYIVTPQGAGAPTTHTKLGEAIRRIKREEMLPVPLPAEEGFGDDTSDLSEHEWKLVHKAFKGR